MDSLDLPTVEVVPLGPPSREYVEMVCWLTDNREQMLKVLLEQQCILPDFLLDVKGTYANQLEACLRRNS